MDAIEPVAPGLRHVSLMQGYKVYGAHLGPFKTPAREDDPPHMPPEFNVDQQDFLESRQRDRAWTWSAIRPSVVCGTALGNPMNLAMVIGVYASITKQLGLPLRFPGSAGAYGSLLEMTDASAAGEGDRVGGHRPGVCEPGVQHRQRRPVPVERHVADGSPRFFELEVAPPLPMSLGTVMADKAALWASMSAEHGLAANYAEVSSWPFGDFVFSWDYDMFGDGSKARRFGFHEYVDTEEMFLRTFARMRELRIIP